MSQSNQQYMTLFCFAGAAGGGVPAPVEAEAAVDRPLLLADLPHHHPASGQRPRESRPDRSADDLSRKGHLGRPDYGSRWKGK